MVGSSRGSAEAAHTGSAVPTTSHTSPGAKTPAPRVAAISSPHPTVTVVPGGMPVASANQGETDPTGSVAAASGGSSPPSSPTASRASADQVRVLGSSSAREDAFEWSTASSPATRHSTYEPG